ncbi:hypothetical protein OK016_02200 [Vibrio chagasii]|nr:hypothetical protein [Vibrio chagasii]
MIDMWVKNTQSVIKPGCLVPEDDFDAQTPAQRRKSGRHGSQRLLLNTANLNRV